MNIEMDVLGASHGNERLGIVVHNLLQNSPQAGLRSRIAHPLAAAVGRRFIGTSQIMNHYPGDLLGDPEDVAAALNMQWLGDHVGRDDRLVYDVHSNTAGLQFQEIGARALKAGVAGAYMRGYTDCIVRPDPFYESVPNGVVLEQHASNEGETEVAAAKLYHGLADLTTMSLEDLEAMYAVAASEMRFLRVHTIYSLPTPGLRDPHSRVVPDRGLLAELEKIAYAPGIQPINLGADIRKALKVPKTGKLFMFGWGYANMSPPLPGEQTADGQARKLCIGDLAYQLTAPVADGKWVKRK